MEEEDETEQEQQQVLSFLDHVLANESEAGEEEILEEELDEAVAVYTRLVIGVSVRGSLISIEFSVTSLFSGSNVKSRSSFITSEP